MKSIALILLIVGIQARVTQAEPTPTQTTHGTINVLLANSHGIVLVTDSRSTATQGKNSHEDNSLKLFKLDSKTICSIAGFATDPGPELKGEGDQRYHPLNLSAAGVVKGYSGWLTTAPRAVSFSEKVDTLTQAMRVSLVGLANSSYRGSVGRLPDPKNYTFQLLMGGSDSNGSMHISKREITISVKYNRDGSNTYFGSISYRQDEIIGKFETQIMRHLTAGIDPKAVELLEHPDLDSNDDELRAFNLAWNKNSAAEYTVQQMKSLAEDIEKQVANDLQKRNQPFVGGPIQVGIVEGGEAAVHIPPEIRTDYKPSDVTNFVVDETIQPSNFLGSTAKTSMARVNTVCEHSGLFIDKVVLVGGRYEGCNFYFNGHSFYRDPNDVAILGGRLIVGPNSTDQAVDDAHRLLPELTVERYTVHLSEHAWVCLLLWSCAGSASPEYSPASLR